MSAVQAPAAWRNRITGQGSEDPTQLLANPRNWRTHPGPQRDALRGSLETVGWVQQILVNTVTGHVIDGHARVEEAISRAEPEVPVLYVELSEEEEAIVLATLDPIAAMATTDEAKLRELLADVAVDDAGLQALLDGLAPRVPVEGLTDPDAVPPLGDETHITRGDLFALGDHRLMCGDSTLDDDLATLMDRDRAHLLYTDPPYGVDYDGGATTPRDRLANDEQRTDIYRQFLTVIGSHVLDSSPMYLWFAGIRCLEAALAVRDAGWTIRALLIWNKLNAHFGALGAQYKHKYEPFFYCHKTGHAPSWYGPTNEVSVWDQQQPSRNELHPTQKPVELVERALTNSSVHGDIVLEPFSGSGSTIIAAEQLGRRCYAMEIDPRYIAVAIERWENFTGRQAEQIDG